MHMRKFTLLLTMVLGVFAANGQTCDDLFFSEYIEGGSNNKAVEIYNPTGSAISLLGYEVRKFSNGGTTATVLDFPASSSIPAYGTYVIANSGSNAAILAVADTTSTITYINGDDPLILMNGTDTIDAIGIVGIDPGASWPVGTGSTANHTLVRKSSVSEGTSDWSLGATQWDVYPQDTTMYLGDHTSNCSSAVVGCDDLFFSEYIEGGSNNKAVEIYNPTGSAISLLGYEVRKFSNGGTTATVLDFPASSSIPAYGTYVIANSGSNAAILAVADTTSTITYINGDDPLILMNGTDTIDAIGIVGIDPGASWPVGTGSTANHTLVRKSSVSEGTSDWSLGATQWDVYPQDTTMYLGDHTSNCQVTTPGPTFSNIVSISSFSSVDASGVADSLTATKWIKAIVTSIDFDGNSGYSFYVADATDGMNIYYYNDVSAYTTPTMGDSVIIRGDVAQYNGLTELVPDSIYLVNQGNMIATPTIVTALNEVTESELVTFIGYELVSAAQWPGAGSSANVDFTNGTDTLKMRIDSDTDIDGSAAPAGMFDLTGIGSQFDSSSPYDGGYQLFPRMLTDIYEYPVIPTYMINQVTGIDAAGLPDSNSVVCKLNGIVLGVDMQGSATAVSFTIHDGVDGIGTYGNIANYNVTEGDSVRIIGDIGQYNGLLQMYLDSVVVISSNNPVPNPATVITSLSEATESELIKFENATLVDPTQWTGGSGYSVDITNGSDTIVMRIDADTDLYGTSAPVGFFDVTGIGGQFTFNAANFDGYQLLPRYLADIAGAAPAYSPKLVVSEIMSGSNASAWAADWFEIHNYGDTVVDLTGFSWDDESGISGTSVFPAMSIAAGEAIVVWNDVAANEDSLLVSWKLTAGSVQVISTDELNGSFPSLSQNGDGVYLFDASGTDLTNSLYLSATAGYTVEFDTTGMATGVAVDGVNGAYTSSLGDVGSPGNLAPNQNVGELGLTGSIYPNPTTGSFQIEMEQADLYSIEVMDIRGVVLTSASVEGSVIPVELNASAGMYLVRVTSAKGTVTQRIQLL